MSWASGVAELVDASDTKCRSQRGVGSFPAARITIVASTFPGIMLNKPRQKFENVADVVRARMRCIRKTDTRPELAVRRTVHKLGYRYRLHRKDLPGTPDLAFPSLRKVILVHGCFWHQHRECQSGTIPQVRQAYWLPKLARNQARDYNTITSLTDEGWITLVVWECETKNLSALETKIVRFLSP